MTASAEDDAAGLAREWAGRTGCLVVVFTASGPLTAGQPVWPCCDTEVRAASGDGRSYGRALHSAAHGALVAVEPATGTGE